MEAEEGRVEVIDIDLNEEPTDSSWNYQDMTNDLENVYTRIEERIRRLEAVTLRARERQENRLSSEPVDEEALSFNEETGQAAVSELLSVGLNPVPEESLKRSNTHLLALALGLESDCDAQVKKNSGEAFFDCNICLGKARDPILTCCGHLYCWPCFYQIPDVGPDTKECPACKGEVNDAGITPIYGSSDKALKADIDKSGLKIPPRPRAHRIESLRQQRITRGPDTLRIDLILRTLHSFSTASSTLSSALNSAERIPEDLEGTASLHRSTGRRYRNVLVTDGNHNILVDVPSDTLASDGNADTETSLPSSSTPTAANGTTSASNGMQRDAAVSLPRRNSPRRRIHSQEHINDSSVPRSRRGRLRRTLEMAQHLQLSSAEQQEQLRSSLRSRTEQQAQLLQRLSSVLQSEEYPPDAPPPIHNPGLVPLRVVTAHSSNAPNTHETVSATREANMTSEASPEPRRRRLR